MSKFIGLALVVVAALTGGCNATGSYAEEARNRAALRVKDQSQREHQNRLDLLEVSKKKGEVLVSQNTPPSTNGSPKDEEEAKKKVAPPAPITTAENPFNDCISFARGANTLSRVIDSGEEWTAPAPAATAPKAAAGTEKLPAPPGNVAPNTPTTGTGN